MTLAVRDGRPAPGDSAGAPEAQGGSGDEDARLAAYIAHELRAPLATQRALLELALADPRADAAAWRDIGADVLEACNHQERLLTACLALSRSRSGLSRYEPVDLAAIAADLLRTKNLHGLTAAARLERASITGDPDLIERLLDNLLTNAARHNTTGGWIHVTTRSTENEALLTVENTGTPILAGEATRLFEPFHRPASQHAPPAGGLGLGLAVVKAVADAHSAVITASARRGGGLRVEVAFPDKTVDR